MITTWSFLEVGVEFEAADREFFILSVIVQGLVQIRITRVTIAAVSKHGQDMKSSRVPFQGVGRASGEVGTGALTNSDGTCL